MIRGERLCAVGADECGLGPRANDLAVWFYWMPWKENRGRAEEQFGWVLRGYEEVLELSDEEKAAIPYLSALRHLWFMVKEVDERMQVGPGDEDEAMRFYVEDHCSGIEEAAQMGLLSG